MDLEYWRRDRTTAEFMAKLTEEVGEVAKEVSKDLRSNPSYRDKHLREELEHVIFIAQQWWERL